MACCLVIQLGFQTKMSVMSSNLAIEFKSKEFWIISHFCLLQSVEWVNCKVRSTLSLWRRLSSMNGSDQNRRQHLVRKTASLRCLFLTSENFRLSCLSPCPSEACAPWNDGTAAAVLRSKGTFWKLLAPLRHGSSSHLLCPAVAAFYHDVTTMRWSKMPEQK